MDERVRQYYLQAAKDAERYCAALKKIDALDPEHDSDQGFNEWGEAHCFRLAQEIAEEALASPSSAKGDPK